jgi:hypothetical protein
MLNSPTGQLVGGIRVRYTRYADMIKPTRTETIMAQNRKGRFIFSILSSLTPWS